MTEIWKGIQEVDGRYQVSNLGKVRNTNTGRVLKPKSDKDGYHEYCLRKDKKNLHRRGHRLVLQAFTPTTDSELVVNHKNNIKYDNNILNLEWVTVQGNTQHYYGGYHKEGRGLSTLSKLEWSYVLYLHRAGISYPAIKANIGLNISRADSIGTVLSGERLSAFTGFTTDQRITDRIVGKISKEQVKSILTDYYDKGVTNGQLALKYSISIAQVHRICNGTRHKEVYEDFVTSRGSDAKKKQ
jgi:hypothetical protein